MTDDALPIIGLDVQDMWPWSERGKCREEVTAGRALSAWWFPEAGQANGPDSKAAIAICNACPVQQECLQWAIRWKEQGLWGGKSARQRQRVPVRVRVCIECNTEFEHVITGGGRQPATCSQTCHDRRRRDQQYAAYEMSDRAKTAGLYRSLGHGTISRYQSGCRCNSCRLASRLKRKEHRAAS